MTTPYLSNINSGLRRVSSNYRIRQWQPYVFCLVLLSVLVGAASASAANLTWDAGNTNNGAAIDPASGSWNTDTTTNFNWNDGSVNVSWTQTGTQAPLNGATFNG